MFNRKFFVLSLSALVLVSSSAWAGGPGDLANKFVVQSHEGISKIFVCGPEAHELKACKPFGDPAGYSTKELNRQIAHQKHVAEGLAIGEGIVVVGTAGVCLYGSALAAAMNVMSGGTLMILAKALALPAIETAIVLAVQNLNPKSHWDQAGVLKRLLEDGALGDQDSPKVAKRLQKVLAKVTGVSEYLGRTGENRAVAGSAY